MIEGKIDVNASITTYLPTTLSNAAIEKLQPITIRDLLQHKSGFPRDAAHANRLWQFVDGPMVAGYSEVALLQDLEAMELINTPGSRWAYSNLGFGTMGYILERVAGIPLPALYDKYLVEKIWYEALYYRFGKSQKIWDGNTLYEMVEKHQNESLGNGVFAFGWWTLFLIIIKILISSHLLYHHLR